MRTLLLMLKYRAELKVLPLPLVVSVATFDGQRTRISLALLAYLRALRLSS
jgi:hypothetical protein